jgi:hypothetical protein
MRGLLSVGILLLMGVSAHAQIAQMRGDDTGGSIPWSADNEMEAQHIAAEYCARWQKYHRITNIHRRNGDFIKFDCLWKPDADRYAQPRLRNWRPDIAEARVSGTNSTPPSASAEAGQAAADTMAELSTQFRQMLATLSADWEGATNAIAELPAQFSRALDTLSPAVQPEMPEGEKKPPKASRRALVAGEKERPKPPRRALVDSSAKETDAPVLVDASSTYAQAE